MLAKRYMAFKGWIAMDANRSLDACCCYIDVNMVAC